jgi:PAS domain S-box-containing protein
MNREMNSLELQAHEELSTLCSESDECIHIGNLLAGRVVAEGKTIASNSILDRPLLIDASWARHHNIVAYAGLPLFVEDHLVGVLTVFAGTLLLERTLSPLAGSAVTLAQGIMRKRAEEALRREKENFRHSLDESPLGVRIVTADGDTLYANRAILDFYGYDSLEELRKTPLRARYTPESYAEFQKRKEQRQRCDLSASEYGISIVRKNGQVLHLHVHRKQVLWDGAKQFLVIYQNITERKQAEIQIQFQANLLANVSDAILATDRQFNVQYWNTAAQKQYGWTSAEVLGRHFMKFIQPQYIGDSRKTVLQKIVQKGFWTGELLHNRSDGTLFPVHVTISEVRNAEGQIIGHVAVNRDITERKLAEQASRRSAESLALLGHTIRSIGECVSVTDTENRILFVNDAFSRTYGYTPDELIGKPISVVRSPRTQPPTDEVLYSTCQGGWRGEMINRKKDGTEFPIALSTSTVRNEQGHVLALVGIAMDITERKRAEDKLRESEERFRTLVESQGEGIGIVDAQECFVFANPAAETIFGVPRGSLIGRSLVEFVKSEQWEIIEAQTNVRREGKRSVYELGIVRADGGTRYLLVTATPRIQDERYSGAFAVFSDITERKQAEEELRKSHEELRMLADRLQTIREEERKRLAREFHDQLGQSMTALKMDLVLLLRTISDEKRDIQRKLVAEELRSMQKLVEDTVRLIWNIIADLRPQMLDDLGLLAAFEWETKQFELRTGISCKFKSSAGDILLDSKKSIALFRIYQEALTNVARHANATVVKSVLRTDNEVLILEIRDNGRGISPSEQLRSESLGLIGMRERAMILGGSFEINGIAGKGTTIIVRLPL